MHLPNTLQNCTDHVATVEKGESDEEQVEGVTQVAAGQNHTEDYVSCQENKLVMCILYTQVIH